MEAVRQSCRPKHQVLVLKCYPKYQKGVQEVKPNPSELSYLLYYASTRRSKLTKVGAFLEKRAARDVWRRKLGNVQVTLQILSALIEKAPRDLPIYARYVLTVLETVIRSNDISMVEDSVATFETFCRHQDVAALAAEQEYTGQYLEVVRTYAGLASSRSSTRPTTAMKPTLAIRWKNAGLRAIKAVVSSEGLTTEGGNLLSVVLPVILENLNNGSENLLPSLASRLQDPEKQEREPARRRRMSTATVQTVDNAEGDPDLALQTAADADRKAEMEMRLLALRCLERVIVNGGSRGQIRIATKCVLDYIVNHHPPQLVANEKGHVGYDRDGDWATSLLELVARWCPVQVRFVIVVTAMEHLHQIDPTDNVIHSLTLTYLIDRLLKAPVNMVGLSVVDVLLGLLRYVLRAAQQTGKADHTADADEKPSAADFEKDVHVSGPRAELLALLEQTIGDLATHIYYGDQVADMVSVILSRLRTTAMGGSAAASTIESHTEALNMSLHPTTSHGESDNEAFNLSIAKGAALRAIKNILVVANLRRPMAAAGVESRNRVGIYVWEGTQWLLRDIDRGVRCAYADAFLSWLKLETNKADLRANAAINKVSRSFSKRDVRDNATQGTRQRAVSSTTHQRQNVMLVAHSNFLRLLHLTMYDMALEMPSDTSNVLLLHLLLASLIEHLGVNAARFGLPMILKLQDDLVTMDSLQSLTAKINIGSLVYGYLWAVTEKFDLETGKVGIEIATEIEARKKRGVWLQRVRLPPANLESIVPQKQLGNQNEENLGSSSPTLTSFEHAEELVRQIEQAYNTFVASPPHSPPTSPGLGFSIAALSHPPPTIDAQKSLDLPSIVSEEMMSSWSREACLAAAVTDNARAGSVNGSRPPTLTAARSHRQASGNGNGDGSVVDTASPNSPRIGVVIAVSNTGLQQFRRMSTPETPPTPRGGSSSRGSAVHVNDLRRVLSVNKDPRNRRLSPLRGRLDASNSSIVSSSTESMVSGSFSVSDMDDRPTSRSQSLHEQRQLASQEETGSETPRASTANGGGDHDEIPPVPPIPLSLSLPGGFPTPTPTESQRSLSPAGHSLSSLGLGGGDSSLKARPSSSRHGKQQPKSRANISGYTTTVNGRAAVRGHDHLSSSQADDGGSQKGDQRDDVRKYLEGFLSSQPDGSVAKSNGDGLVASSSVLSTPQGSVASRRPVSRGIGRPPY